MIIHINSQNLFFNTYLSATGLFFVEKSLLWDEKISSFLQ